MGVGSPGDVSEPGRLYFRWQAYWGYTKHPGGLKATRMLIDLCRIGKGKYVLDAGCGVKATACYVVRRCGCEVVGVRDGRSG